MRRTRQACFWWWQLADVSERDLISYLWLQAFAAKQKADQAALKASGEMCSQRCLSTSSA